MATFLVVLPGSGLGCLTACLTFVYSTLEIVKIEYKMHIIAAQSLNGRQPDHEQCRMLYLRSMLLRLCLDVYLSANRKKLGGCFPLYSKDFRVPRRMHDVLDIKRSLMKSMMCRMIIHSIRCTHDRPDGA
jgi:hypothetical protein